MNTSKAAARKLDYMPGGCENCQSGDFGTCPRCFENTGIGCGHGAICPDCTSEIASLLGRLGGKAGTGEAKRRGDSAYYKALRAKVKRHPVKS